MKTITSRILFLFVLLGIEGFMSLSPNQAATVNTKTTHTDFPLADFKLSDLDGNGTEQLLLVGKDGRITLWPRHFAAAGSFTLPFPEHCLLCPVPGSKPAGNGALAALTPEGLFFYKFETDTGLSPEGTRVLPEAGLEIRLGYPRFAPILQDVNGDQYPDLLFPTPKTYQLWLQRDPRDGMVQFGLTAHVRTDIKIARQTQAQALSDRLEDSFYIPSLHFEDVNGDGRADLLAVDDQRRSFHIQTEAGEIPPEPDVVLDLGIFRDTTPRSDIRPGRTLAGMDDPTLAMQDLNGDGIQDYVIAHRRKLWIFHGSEAVPQFTNPSSIMKTAEDVTVVLITRLDDDDFPDLLLLRVQIPSVGMILKGLFTNIDIEISATGYASKEGETFSAAPQWRGGVTLRLPELMKIIRDPQSLIERLQNAADQFRDSTSGDFNGDGREDIAVLNNEGDRLEIWIAQTEKEAGSTKSALRQILFEDDDRVWSIDRILAAISELAEKSYATMTGGREPDTVIPIDRLDTEETVALLPRTIADQPRQEILLLTRDSANGERAVIRAIDTGFAQPDQTAGIERLVPGN